MFYVGSIALILSGIIRLWAYQALGTLFTFELSIRKDHTLITSGPYAYVRHPSYTGILLNVIGALLLHFGSGSWFYEFGFWGSWWGRMYAGTWICLEGWVLSSLFMRVGKEDAMLEREFRPSWRRWARDVPWRIVPGIF